MPRIRLERMAIRSFCLGLLGFNHLQLVFEPMAWGRQLQDDWFVIEGVRDGGRDGPRLGVQGADGTVSLSRANAASGPLLTERIGTPEQRLLVDLAVGPRAAELWQTFAASADDIERQLLPYVAYASPSSVLPTINSTSVIATLLHRAGLAMPSQMHRGALGSPGSETLIGTAGDDTLISSAAHTTLLGGPGDDRLVAGGGDGETLKFYGGSGNDTCLAAERLAVCHGGLPSHPPSQDGRDTAMFSSRTSATIDVPASAREGEVSVAQANTQTRLVSIEVLRWGDRNDEVRVGEGLVRSPSAPEIDLGGEAPSGLGDVLDISRETSGQIANVHAESVSVKSARHGGSLTVRSVETMITSEAGDMIWIGGQLRSLDTGGGSDVIWVARDTLPSQIDLGSGADMMIVDARYEATVPRIVEIAPGEAGDRLALVVATDACGIVETAPTVISGPGSYAGVDVAFRPEAGRLLVTLSQSAGSPVTLVLNAYRPGDWGLRADDGAARRSAAISINDCEDQRNVDGRIRGVLAASVAQHLGPFATRLPGVLFVACRLSDRFGDTAGDAPGVCSISAKRYRRQGHSLRASTRGLARGRRRPRRRDDPAGRRQRSATGGSACAIPTCLPGAGRRMAAAGASARSPNRTAVGPPGGAGLRRWPAR